MENINVTGSHFICSQSLIPWTWSFDTHTGTVFWNITDITRGKLTLRSLTSNSANCLHSLPTEDQFLIMQMRELRGKDYFLMQPKKSSSFSPFRIVVSNQ